MYQAKLYVFIVMIVFELCAPTFVSAELIGHWKLDAISDGVTADATANGNNAVIKQNVSLTQYGKHDNAMMFNGNGDHLEISSNADALNTIFTAFTAMAWIKPVAGSNYEYVMGKMGPRGERGWDIWVNAGLGKMRITIYSDTRSGNRNSPTDSLAVNVSIPAEEWTHIVAVFEGGKAVSIYVNGELAGHKTTAIPLLNGKNNSTFEIGRRGTAGGNTWHGQIDDVKIFNEAFSKEIIKQGFPKFDLKASAVKPVEEYEKDSTDILQKAIDSKSKVIITKAGSPWITRPLTLRSNLEIFFEEGAVLKAKRGAYKDPNDALLYAECCSNIIIRGQGSIIMNKADYQNPKKYKRGEWRHAIYLAACNNVTIKDLKISNTGGDGIYLGAKNQKEMVQNDLPNYCKNIVIDSCHISQAHRNGISVISAENLRISNCEIVDNIGTSPQAGIDFEPNFTSEPLVNCLVENCVISGNKSYGVLLAAFNINGLASPIDITVKNCKLKGNGRGVVLIKGYKEEVIANPVNGMIKFVNCQIEGSAVRSLEFRDVYTDGYKVVFQDCNIIAPALNAAVFNPILMNISKTMKKNIGGCISFINTSLVDPQNRELIQVISKAKDSVVFDKMKGIIVHNKKTVEMDDYVYGP